MQKKIQSKINTTIALVVALLITYLVFPSFYIHISQKIFTVLYSKNTELRNEIEIGKSMPVTGGETENMLQIRTIARPPQTPHDFLITTAPHKQTDEMSHYVYTETHVPVGYIEKKYASVFVVTLFSAPKSNEQFAVNRYVSAGTGNGGGSFSIEVPNSIPVEVGMPIMHQATGRVVSAVVSVKDIPKKQMQQVTGIIQRSPLEIATLYLKESGGEKKITTQEIEEAVQSVDSTIIEEVSSKEGVADEEEDNKNTERKQGGENEQVQDGQDEDEQSEGEQETETES